MTGPENRIIDALAWWERAHTHHLSWFGRCSKGQKQRRCSYLPLKTPSVATGFLLSSRTCYFIHLESKQPDKKIYKYIHQRQNPQLERLSLQPPPEAGTCYPGHCVFPFSFHHSPPFFQAAPGLSLCRHLRLPSALGVRAGTRFSGPF